MRSLNGEHGSAALGATLIIVSSLLYASYGVWTTLMGESFGAFMQAALRGMFVLALLLPFALWRKKLVKIHWRRDAKWLILMFASCFLLSGPIYYSTLQIGVGLATAIYYTGIVLTMLLLGRLFSGEKFTRDKLFATILGFAGLWLVFAPNVEHFGWIAMGAALLAGFGSGLDMVTTQKFPYNATQTTIVVWVGVVIANMSIALIAGERIPPIAWDVHWLYLLIFATVSVFASWVIIKGIKLIEAGVAGLLGLLEIVFGVLFGVILFHERPGVITTLGVLLILVGSAIPYIRHLRDRAAKRLEIH